MELQWYSPIPRELPRQLLEQASTGQTQLAAGVYAPCLSLSRMDLRKEGMKGIRGLTQQHRLELETRLVGGRCLQLGPHSLGLMWAWPEARLDGVHRAYPRLQEWLLRALAPLLPVQAGEPPGSWCPGAWSLRLPGGGKLVGLAGRRSGGGALLQAVLMLRPPQPDLHPSLYQLLGLDYDPASLSVSGLDVQAVREALTAAARASAPAA